LPRGRHALDAEAAARNHRERLRAGTVELVVERGYGASTMEALAAQAGVSTATLYGLYASKQELVLDTARSLIAGACQQLDAEIDRQDQRPLDALTAVLGGVATLVARDPDGARLAIVEISGAGAPAVALRQQLIDDLQRRMAQAMPDPAPISDAALAVLAGGVVQVLEQHLRSGRLRALRGAVAALAGLGASYETSEPLALPARQAAPYGGRTRPRSPRALSLPSGRRALPAVFVARHQRARIREAIITLAAEQGLESVSVRDISAQAGISRDTYSQYFADKDAAVRAVYDDAFVELFASSWYAAAEHTDWPGEVTAALTALLQFAAAEPELARFGLVDARSAGRTTVEQIDTAYGAFAGLLARGQNATGAHKVGALVPYALAGGIASLVGAWIVDDRAAELPELAPQLTYVVLTPFLGEARARRETGLDDQARRHQPAVVTAGDERQRLIAAFAELTHKIGFGAAKLVDAAAQAGIGRDVALGLFEDEVDLTNQAVDAWAGQMVVNATSAFVSSPTDPAIAAHRALAVALQYMADTPTLTALALLEEPRLAEADLARRERFMHLFFELITDQVPEADNRAQRPRATLQLVLGGLLATVRNHAREDRLQELPAELTTLSLQCLAPFFGADHAARVATLPADSTLAGDASSR
jgi:AcrR family transcriptional regulator